ncbi:MAG: esterase-like activity of phytase family protein [Acidobacteriota bacterium]
MLDSFGSSSPRAGAPTPSTPLSNAISAALVALLMAAPMAPALADVPTDGPFRRIATFPVFTNTDADTETVAEIVTGAQDGELLIYTDGATEAIGFVDIQNPAAPAAAGTVPVGGEPTSVATVGDYALVAVNTSESFVDPSGLLRVVDVVSRTVVRTLDLGGQPDSIAVSPDGRYAAVVIENERDEDLGDGAPPQAPAGFLVIVDLVGEVANWTTRVVDLVGIADRFPEDPEPEFVDINAANEAVVTLQENNHVVIVDLPSGQVLAEWSAGTVDLTQVDTEENGLIELSSTLTAVPREPDAVTWITLDTLATADEGDLDGGSRGFTLFHQDGTVLFQPGNAMEHLVARLGHYPEERSENKGNEPEAVEVGHYAGADPYLFVGSERSSVVVVYRLSDSGGDPELVQVLPTGVAPEGLLALPGRDIFVVASEEDARDDKIRSSISIYQRLRGGSDYPKVVSVDRPDGTPIPWAALSGLALDPVDSSAGYAVPDSFYGDSRIYRLDLSGSPARIVGETVLVDGGGVLRQTLNGLKQSLPGTDDFDPEDLIGGDGTVDLDLEGVAAVSGGAFWVVSEGAGNLVGGVSDPDSRPFESPNLLLQVAADGEILQAIALPLEVVSNQLRFGFEGVAVDGDGAIYVAFQRAWQDAGDPADRVRIARYSAGQWTFAHYPLDAPESPNGGWVGLSDLTYLGAGRFGVLERDNQGGPDAAVKRIYTVDVSGVTFVDASAPGFPLLAKELATDLLADGHLGVTAGPVLEKWEGLLALPDGTAVIVNDNDGVDDSSGETQLLRIQGLFSGDGGAVGTVAPFVCVNTETTVCLNGGRFEVSSQIETSDGTMQAGRIADAGTGDSALLWFFDAENWEVLLKVLDGCASNGHYWVFSAATTDVGYTLQVVDSHTGVVRTYENSVGNAAAAVTDTGAFPTCP